MSEQKGKGPPPPRQPDAETAATAGVTSVASPTRRFQRIVEPPPERVGVYRVIRELGKGGMGAVYLAVRDDEQFTRQVAIKVIKRGMDSEHILRRFELERQVLASLNHPNIARLFDGGITDDGRPYFVMEYIEGQAIDRYCDNNRLTIEERLEIFRGVCAAIHYAHQNLVVHRDLKPGNILVTKEGMPKLVDFGIAKLLNPSMSPADMVPTAAEIRLMTPEYASPEQVRGDPISTSSDVYSLGVLLYEVLTGHRPYRLRSRLQAEIERVICFEEPEKPSTAISKVEEIVTPPTVEEEITGAVSGPTTTTITPESVSKTRAGRPERLRRRLEGDIDNIVLMAMRKEPQRRYTSAEQLSEDIRRHLSGMPVIASKDTVVYRMAKFVRRNKLEVAAAALIALSLVGGVIGTSWQANVAAAQRDQAVAQRQLADERFNQVRSLAHIFMFDFHDSIEKLPGATAARELLVKTAREYLDKLSVNAGDNLGLKKELAAAYERVGDVQGGIRGGNLGADQAAMESYQTALALRKSILQADPADADSKRAVAVGNIRISTQLIRTGNTAGAITLLREAVALREELAKANPTGVNERRGLSIALTELGEALRRTGDLPAAAACCERALALKETLAAEPQSDPEVAATLQRSLSVSLIEMSSLTAQMGDTNASLDYARRAIRVRERLFAAAPDNAREKRDLLVARWHTGMIHLRRNEPDAALEYLEPMKTAALELAAADPINARAKRDVLAAYEAIGDAHKGKMNLDAARDSYAELRTHARSMRAASPESVEAAEFLSSSLSRIGDVQCLKGDFDDAVETYVEYLDLAGERAAADPASVSARRDVAVGHLDHGRACLGDGRVAPAVESLRRAQTILEALAQSSPEDASLRSTLASVRLALGEALLEAADYTAARQALESASDSLAGLRALDAANVNYIVLLAEVREGLGKVARRAGDLAEARRNFEAADVEIRSVIAAQPTARNPLMRRATILSGLADVIEQEGDPARALELLKEARSILPTGPLGWEGDHARSHIEEQIARLAKG